MKTEFIIANEREIHGVSRAFKDLHENIVLFPKLLIFIVEYFAYFKFKRKKTVDGEKFL